MNTLNKLSLIALALFIQNCTPNTLDELPDKELTYEIEGVKYQSGNWEHPNYSEPFTTFGNHRFLVETGVGDTLVQVTVPWRRHDSNSEQKAVIVTSADNDNPLESYRVLAVSRESGHLVFRTLPGVTRYHIYYLPHQSTGSYYPKVRYLSQEDFPPTQSMLADLSAETIAKLPKAKVISAQSIDDFHSFYPMEVTASQAELDKFFNQNPQEVYLFPEYRDYPIAMQDQLPRRWIAREPMAAFQDIAQKGEYFTFQIGLYPHTRALEKVQVTFSELNSGRHSIPAEQLSCFNTGGTDLFGQAFTKTLRIEKQQIQPLWIGIDIPENARAGVYRGEVTIEADDFKSTLPIAIQVSNSRIENHGDDNPEKMSRLRWFNSTLGRDTSFIVPPFTPVSREGRTLHVLGRDIKIGDHALPEQIQSFFPQEMTYLGEEAADILSAPMSFEVIPEDGRRENWKNGDISFQQPNRGEIHWQMQRQSERFTQDIDATLEYDGTLSYDIRLSAKETVHLSNTLFRIPWQPDAARYMLGLGETGGLRPENFDWNWDINFHHEGLWLGNVNKGLQYVLRDENYVRPLNTNFYQNQPLKLPSSWGNDGKGGISLRSTPDRVQVENYSGARTMEAGESLVYHIRFLITPFKTLDTRAHFSTRFVHKYVPVDTAIAYGGTVINVHHANEINPYINYPFYNLDLQKAYIDEAHSKGVKVKLYNTIREITYKAHELFPMRSFGYEILNDGEGGGHGWLQEHLGNNYHSAWHATRVNDAAILNKGNSRWTNYYIEGLNWLAKNQNIDGLYLDDIAFSRETVKRLVQVLHKNRPEVIIDLHSANQFNPRDGFINSAFLYMEHFPYVTRLWFGEYFDYEADPEYWMTEVAGIPFGLGGEMLEKGGHPFRGLVYGMTTRVYGDYNPGAIWKLFDSFDIPNARMLGYWVDDSPIKTSQPGLKSTLYLHPDKALLAIGSWSERRENARPEINWQALKLEASDYEWVQPAVEGLQDFRRFDTGEAIPVEAGQGIILLLQKKN